MKSVDEVELPAGSLVIADLHLDVEEPRDVERFVAWLAEARGVPRLLILGDLFEFWIGPAQIEVGDARRVLAALRELVDAGTPIDVVPGNRDFLLDASFERASGCRIRRHGVVGLSADGEKRLLFLHGDELATEDKPHMRLRRVLRSPLTRAFALSLPRRAALAIARRLRATSRKATGRKDPIHMALQPVAVRAYSRHHRAEALVCGHAHRWRDEQLDDGPRWVVLDAFGGTRDTLVVDAQGALSPVTLHGEDAGAAL